MAQKRSLIDAATDTLSKENFINEENKNPKAQTVVEMKMLNTTVSKDLIKRIKAYCVEQETTVKDFVALALEEKLKRLGK